MSVGVSSEIDPADEQGGDRPGRGHGDALASRRQPHVPGIDEAAGGAVHDEQARLVDMTTEVDDGEGVARTRG